LSNIITNITNALDVAEGMAQVATHLPSKYKTQYWPRHLQKLLIYINTYKSQGKHIFRSNISMKKNSHDRPKLGSRPQVHKSPPRLPVLDSHKPSHQKKGEHWGKFSGVVSTGKWILMSSRLILLLWKNEDSAVFLITPGVRSSEWKQTSCQQGTQQSSPQALASPAVTPQLPYCYPVTYPQLRQPKGRPASGRECSWEKQTRIFPSNAYYKQGDRDSTQHTTQGTEFCSVTEQHN
jgi:hypothetical protein